LFFNLFSASFCTAFLSAGIATSISVHVTTTIIIIIIIIIIIYTYLPMKMEQTECSKTSAYKIQTPGNFTQNKTYNIHNTAKL
jgi:hypothetical protein